MVASPYLGETGSCVDAVHWQVLAQDLVCSTLAELVLLICNAAIASCNHPPAIGQPHLLQGQQARRSNADKYEYDCTHASRWDILLKLEVNFCVYHRLGLHCEWLHLTVELHA